MEIDFCSICDEFYGVLSTRSRPEVIFCTQTCAQRYYGFIKENKIEKSITPKKARKILKHGFVYNQKLTNKQKRYFGWVAGGRKKRKKKIQAKNNKGQKY